ncbi:hypothetical protein HNR40_010814, partial [Nonomuraea endophytica]|nr:hypothetical protein [Nonomuraea endophytica]MBB5085300.1 hypothetical protein [Nonomuraea endophytica]
TGTDHLFHTHPSPQQAMNAAHLTSTSTYST